MHTTYAESHGFVLGVTGRSGLKSAPAGPFIEVSLFLFLDDVLTAFDAVNAAGVSLGHLV